MKKILFIAITFIGFSKMAAAQEGARVGVTPVPTKAQVAKDVNAKMQSQSAQQTKMDKEKQPRWIDPNTENYKKAGLTDPQITTMSSEMRNLELKKNSIHNNTSITDEQKRIALGAVEKERQAILQKNMEPATYKKYTEVSEANQALTPSKDKTP